MFMLVFIFAGFCSDFLTEDYTETHYTDDGTPVVTKPHDLVSQRSSFRICLRSLMIISSINGYGHC